jgi:hypothetical protein
MSKPFLSRTCLLILLCFAIILNSCSKKSDRPTSAQQSDDTWDIDKNGVPNFVTTDYIESAKIGRVSKYRSSIGHDYSDSLEHCRSMKHYFEPLGAINWATVNIFSPVRGIVTRTLWEWAGLQIEIQSKEYPAFRFIIFHLNTPVARTVGDTLQAGQPLGTHIGSQTMSDIAVIVNDPARRGRLVSYFEVMTDSLFRTYISRGVGARADMIIPKEVRDANPLTCVADSFVTTDTLANWVVLN